MAYEADSNQKPPDLHGIDADNWREKEQARNLTEAVGQLGSDAKVLVWCGNNHNDKVPLGKLLPMGLQFKEQSGIDPFTIDQGQTVQLDPAHPNPFVDKLVETYRPALEQRGGTAALLDVDTPFPGQGEDAYIFSTDNAVH